MKSRKARSGPERDALVTLTLLTQSKNIQYISNVNALSKANSKYFSMQTLYAIFNSINENNQEFKRFLCSRVDLTSRDIDACIHDICKYIHFSFEADLIAFDQLTNTILAILEVQGPGHYGPINYGYSDKDEIRNDPEYTQMKSAVNDYIKMKYCECMGILYHELKVNDDTCQVSYDSLEKVSREITRRKSY